MQDFTTDFTTSLAKKYVDSVGLTRLRLGSAKDERVAIAAAAANATRS